MPTGVVVPTFMEVLDTTVANVALRYIAGATASDALWAELPLVTCRGESFAGRVAASLLKAVGLAELVTNSLEEYEAVALRLATDPSLLDGLRERLKQNRLTYPLFDTDRYRRHIEAAYTRMWELWQRGEAPRSFAVEPGAWRHTHSHRIAFNAVLPSRLECRTP